MNLLELNLQAVDVEAQRKFYCGMLGLREAVPGWEGTLSIQAGRTCLNFQPAAPGWYGFYHFAFAAPPGRFEAAGHWLCERVTPIASLEGQTHFFHENWHSDALYFRDPAGNILEIICERKAPLAADAGRPFNVTEISAVCEIGIVTHSVSAAVAELNERMPGIGVNEEQNSDQFAPIGDSAGRLIVVLNGRMWYPDTGVPAVPLPLDVLVEIEDGNRLQRQYRLTAPPYPFSVKTVQ